LFLPFNKGISPCFARRNDRQKTLAEITRQKLFSTLSSKAKNPFYLQTALNYKYAVVSRKGARKRFFIFGVLFNSGISPFT